MHELMHIKYEDRNSPIDEDIMLLKDELPEIEKRANKEAANLLIPTENMDSFINRVKPYYSRKRVVQFAQARSVHPGIVVGQLQYRDEIKYHQLRPDLVKVRKYITESAITDGWKCALSF